MKTYVITLERSKERNHYIRQHIIERKLDYKIIAAVDGSLLTEKDIEETCNMEEVNKYRWWLNNGAIGCALSHLNAYKEFLKTNDRSAFIIEDDVVLPENINSMLKELDQEIKPDEIILLYNTSFEPAQFSSIGKVDLSVGGLYYPMDIQQNNTATAYVVGRTAAENLEKMIIPIEVAADSWHHFYAKEAFKSFRVHYPSLISTMNFKSFINYFKKGSIKELVSRIINEYKIPVLYQIVRHKRKKNLNKRINHFSLSEDISPIYKKISS